jgi:hypothetical protein
MAIKRRDTQKCITLAGSMHISWRSSAYTYQRSPLIYFMMYVLTIPRIESLSLFLGMPQVRLIEGPSRSGCCDFED